MRVDEARTMENPKLWWLDRACVLRVELYVYVVSFAR